jgi:hypothetical protein
MLDYRPLMNMPAAVLLLLGPTLASGAADEEEAESHGWPRFRVQELHQDRNEGLAVADYNGDGHVDISAGEFWYQGPDFTKQRRLRELKPFAGGEWLTNHGEHALDLNLDGHPDIITGSFMETEQEWYENPGPEGLQEERMWKRHVLIDTGLKENEPSLMADIDGDGALELLVNHWNDGRPMRYYKITPAKAGPKVETISLAEAGEQTNGHGAGVGDLNGSGRNDIIYKNGWYEQLEGGAWKRHAVWTKPFMSLPALVVDVNGDGRADMVWGNGHDYGLYWEEQLEPAADGSLRFRQHVIDDTWSQAHVLVWHDLDGDGKPELITGKRYYGHGGKDPGANDGLVLYAYKWNAGKNGFDRHPIVVSEPGAKQGPGVGLQLRVADFNGDGRPDLAAAGKSGTYIIWNEGPPK